jgi:multidrug resistance efflux pump
VEAVGTVQSRVRSVVSSRIVAAVTAVHVVEGQRVERDAALVSLDDRDIVAQRRRAEAAVREARFALEEAERAIRAAGRAADEARAESTLAGATLDRYRVLRDRELIALQQFDEVQARARVAHAAVERHDEARAALVARRSAAAARI